MQHACAREHAQGVSRRTVRAVVVTHLRTASFQLKRIRSDFKEWLDMPMVEMDPVLPERWRAVRVRAGSKPVTINRNLQRLHALVGKAVEWKAMDRHPFSGLKPLKHDRSGRVRYLDEEEEQQLRDALLKRETSYARIVSDSTPGESLVTRLR
jgi:hypothetical protein